MLIAKVLIPNKEPEFWHIIKQDQDGWTLINYPISKPNRKREAKWVRMENFYVDWLREFIAE